MSESTWADSADRAIARALAELPEDATPAECRKAIREAYPFGPRKYWPYKAWLSRRKAWLAAIEHAHASGTPRPRYLNPPTRRPATPRRDKETLSLFGGGR